MNIISVLILIWVFWSIDRINAPPVSVKSDRGHITSSAIDVLPRACQRGKKRVGPSPPSLFVAGQRKAWGYLPSNFAGHVQSIYAAKYG
jgi:hypothetical protein